MKLVIVESPAKAKTINKYLGNDYIVEASYGHVCDLPSKNGSVIPDQDFLMKYEVSPRAMNYVKKLCQHAKKADEIILATDPDREGEAISWHIIRILKEYKSISPKTKISRISFNEITKKAVNEAILTPRDIDDKLVDAQQARRALDYLVGFTLSPILWRKLPGAKSAGRVQSVALKLICEREEAIERFKTDEYWDVTIELKGESDKSFNAKLHTAFGDKLQKLSINSAIQAEDIKNNIAQRKFKIELLDKKSQKRSPQPPFTTSTLQQEASRKLGYSAKKTMQLAQKLYEGLDIDGESVGLITYMRTDGVTIAEEAIGKIRSYIETTLGNKYLPSSPKIYKTKSKNAQEAHEAIRPTDITRTTEELKDKIDKDLLRLYELIWRRTTASQVENAEVETAIAEATSEDNLFKARATGTIIKFDGFYKIYREGIDDQGENDEGKILPPLKVNESLDTLSILPKQHFTEPPPRFTEASLVKKLEELGIGRPSTYASIISVIIDREYVVYDKKKFLPEEKGRIVNAFLVKFFGKYVEYDFTAELEDDLDKIAGGEMDWKKLLHQFWQGFNSNIGEVSEKTITEVIDSLNESLADHLFPQTETDPEPRKCKACENGTLGLRLGKFGAFISCSNYPTCNFKKSIDNSSANNQEVSDENNGELTELKKVNEDKLLGQSSSNTNIWLKKGPYGFYIQEGEFVKGGEKPKRSALPSSIKPDNVDLNTAIQLLSLPIILGKDPASNESISIGIGKYGPYIKCGNKFTSVPKDVSPFDLDLNKAVQIIASDVKLKKRT